MMTLVHSDEAVIHLMQVSLVISHCRVTFLVFWLSRGSVAGAVGEVHTCAVHFKSNSEKCIKIRWFWRSD